VCSTVTGLSAGNPTVYGLDKYGEVEEQQGVKRAGFRNIDDTDVGSQSDLRLFGPGCHTGICKTHAVY